MHNKIQIIKILKELLIKHFGNNIQDVILFGSRAIGKATEFSDYDVLIILKKDYDWKYRKKINHTIYDMELNHEILFDTHLLSLNEIQHSLKGAEPMYINAINKGIYA